MSDPQFAVLIAVLMLGFASEEGSAASVTLFVVGLCALVWGVLDWIIVG